MVIPGAEIGERSVGHGLRNHKYEEALSKMAKRNPLLWLIEGAPPKILYRFLNESTNEVVNGPVSRNLLWKWNIYSQKG